MVFCLIQKGIGEDKLGFGEVSNTWNGGLREVMTAGRLCGETDATCGQPVSSIDSLALISTRSGTKLVRNLAKCRRSQMSIPEAGCPHMAVCLEDRRHAGRTVVYCMIGKIMKLK